MKYRDIYRKICQLAADHLDSLEVYDEFEPEDEDRIDRAINEIQRQLKQKSEPKIRLTREELEAIDQKVERQQDQLDERMTLEFGVNWAILKTSTIRPRMREIWQEITEQEAS